MFEKVRAFASKIRGQAEKFAKDVTGMEDLTNLVIGLVVIGVVGYVGLYIMNEVYTLTSITSASVFYTASMSVLDIINTGFGLTVIAVLALVAGIIITYLITGMGQAR